MFEHRRVAAPVFPVSNNETADSTFRGRCLRLIVCLWHLRLEPVNVQQAPSALSSNNRVCLRLAMTRLLWQSLLKNRSRVVVVHDIASFYTYFTMLKIADILN